jgi:uncharacterized membrane protein (DUF485 family)
MLVGIGLPGATEFVIILVVGVLVLGIVVTTLAISRARRRDRGPGSREPDRTGTSPKP